MLTHETYHRNVQLGASRRRYEDAKHLLDEERWVGAMYLGGYAVECALVALICFRERKTDFRDTRAFQSGIQKARIHNLSHLVDTDAVRSFRNAIALDKTGQLKADWNLVASYWQYKKLRYYHKVGIGDRAGARQLARNFVDAVERVQRYLMSEQGE